MMSRSSPPRYIGLVRTPAACVARRVAIASSRAAPALAAAATRAATRPRTSTRSSWVHRRGAAPPEDRARRPRGRPGRVCLQTTPGAGRPVWATRRRSPHSGLGRRFDDGSVPTGGVQRDGRVVARRRDGGGGAGVAGRRARVRGTAGVGAGTGGEDAAGG